MTALEAPSIAPTPATALAEEFVPPMYPTAPRPLGLAGWPRVVRTFWMAAGTAIALGVAFSNPDRNKPELRNQWLLWAAVAGILGGLSGSTIGSGVARWRDLQQIQRVPLRRVLPSIVSFLVLAAASVATAYAILGDGLTWRAVAFVSMVVLGAVPAGATLAGLRVISMRGLTGTPGEQLAALMRLRRMLARVLQMMGSLLLVMVLVCAAAVGWGREEIPQSTSLVIGAAGSILIALVHVPTATLLRRRCQMYVDEFSDIAHVEKADLIRAAEDRIKLEEFLGVNRTTLSELQAGLVIVGPLAATAIAAIIPKF